MSRQHFSRNSNSHLYVAIPKETAEGLFEVGLTPLIGWLVSGEDSPNFEGFHLVAVSTARFPAERPYAIYDEKMESWQDIDASGRGLDSLLQHLASEAEQWKRFEAECRADLMRGHDALAAEGSGPEKSFDSDLLVIHRSLLANPIKTR